MKPVSEVFVTLNTLTDSSFYKFLTIVILMNTNFQFFCALNEKLKVKKEKD